MPRLVDPIYMKTGTTDILMGSSTGALYHQGTILPDTSSFNTLSNMTLSSGGTVDFSGAFQHKFTSTAASAVTLPAATDAVLMWTTEVAGKITAPTSQINVLGVAVWPSTAAHTLVATTVTQNLTNKTLGAGTVANVETGSTATGLVNYGVSLLAYSSDAGKAYTLAAPAVGINKTVVLNTTAVPDTTGVFSSVYTGSTAIFIMDNSTTYAPKLYAGFGPPYSLVELVGVTTALWGIKAAYGNAKFSTSAVFST